MSITKPGHVTGTEPEASDKDLQEHFGYQQSRSSDTQMSSHPVHQAANPEAIMSGCHASLRGAQRLHDSPDGTDVRAN